MASNTLMEALFGSEYALIATIVGFIIIIAFSHFLRGRPKDGSRLPPWSSPSLFQNMRLSQNQKGLAKVSLPLKLAHEFPEGSFGRTTYGSTFRIALPMLTRVIVTTDYELGRLILQGNSSANVVEGEKTFLQRNLNFVDRSTYSILTHLTSNPDRERARKAAAPCFSTTSLQLTWPYIETALEKEFAKLREMSKTGEKFNGRVRILQLFLALLGKSAFGIEFTMDGTENDNNISGLEYLEAQHEASSSRVKEVGMPWRRYLFWNSDVQKGNRACEALARISAKILKLHNEKAVTKEGNTAVYRHSLIDHVSKHAYPTELARLTDLNILTLGGHDTTAFSFSFFLMEIARHPEVKAKLIAEIATVMPAAPLGSKKLSADSLHHGDQKVLSAICGLEYLNWCIKEAMRLWPVIAVGGIRDLTQDITYKGMLLPKGSTVNCHFHTMFRESWIDRPHEYLPERWSTANPQLPQLKEMFIPFSVGKRACIGQNMAMFQLRLMGAYFLHNFDFTLAAEPTFEMFITFKPDELMMKVKERHHVDTTFTAAAAAAVL